MLLSESIATNACVAANQVVHANTSDIDLKYALILRLTSPRHT